ncbi:MAG: glycosyltransferase [Bacilli bacterium]|nr:glycosyltransferase [Bacilli bacterium]
MNKLKIGVFLDDFYPNINGVILVMENLIKCMSKYADITLVVPKTGNEENDKNYPFKIIRINSIPLFNTGYNLGMADIRRRKINRMFENLEFDIIHIHTPFVLGRLGIKIARKKNIPVIITMHTRWEFELKKYLKSKLLAKIGIKHLIKTYNKCDCAICLNNALVNVYKEYGYKGDLTIINNGTDMKIISNKKESINKINKLYNIKSNEYVFLFVGRIISIKNIYFILDVLKKLKEKRVQFKMIYIGDGPDFNELKRKIKDYGLENEVIMTGKITDRAKLKEFYYRATLFLFPSLYDASSLVQIEAASQQTPTIFIENSVTSDTVLNNVNGFTAKNDPKLYADRIIEILNNNKLYNKVKNRAKKDLAKPWEDIAKETYKFYLKTIKLKKEK